MRKIIAGWLAGIWLCLLLVRLPVQAANLAEPIQAQAYVLMEQESGTVLAEAQADVPLPMDMICSTTSGRKLTTFKSRFSRRSMTVAPLRQMI